MSYILSAVIFLFIRCFAKDRWDLNMGVEITTPNTDALEQKYLTMEVFQAFCAPMVTTYAFYYGRRSVLDSSVVSVLEAFFWMEVAQTAFCVFIDFVTIYEARTRGTPPDEGKWQ